MVGVGGGGGPETAPLFVNGQPHRDSYDKGYQPSGKGPKTPRRMKGRWDESSVEQDMFIIEETKKALDALEYTTVEDKSDSLKKNLKRELEALGWAYRSAATFKANFPFRNKHLVFDLIIIKDGVIDMHRIKVTMGRPATTDYKLMKWVPKLTAGRDITEMLFGLFSTKKGLIILAVCLLVLIALLVWWSSATEIDEDGASLLGGQACNSS